MACLCAAQLATVPDAGAAVAELALIDGLARLLEDDDRYLLHGIYIVCHTNPSVSRYAVGPIDDNFVHISRVL